jgi:hypothetical protein
VAFLDDDGPRADSPSLAGPDRSANLGRIPNLAMLFGNALTALTGRRVARTLGRHQPRGTSDGLEVKVTRARPRRAQWAGRWVAAALAMTLGAAGAVIPWGAPASAASPATPHCVRTAYGYGGQSLHCYATLRQAISYATDGRVTDAPETGAAFLDNAVADAVLAKINAAGDAARAAGGSNHFVPGIVFDAADYGGYSYTMSTTPSFAKSSGPMTPCRDENHWAEFWAAGFTPRSLLNFNHCYYNTHGIEWYANDRIRYVNSPTIPSDNNTRYISYRGGPTRQELLNKCGSGNTCTFVFANTTTPLPSAQYYGKWDVYDQLFNCSTGSEGSYELWAEKTVGGAVDVGVELEVKTGTSIFGQKIELAFKTTFGMTWSWSTTMTKRVIVTVPAGQWAGLYGRPLFLSYKGKYVLSGFSTAYYGRTYWTIPDVTVTGPAGNDAAQWKVEGGAIAGSGYEDLCASPQARSSGVTPLPQGWEIVR